MLRTSLAALLFISVPALAQEGSDWNYSAWNASSNPSYRSVAIAAWRTELAEEDNPVEAQNRIKVYEADLNFDGEPELLIEYENDSSCDSDGCMMRLVSKMDGAFRVILDGFGRVEHFEPSDRISNGYLALTSTDRAPWIFDGTQYDIGSLEDTEQKMLFNERAPAPVEMLLPTGRYWLSVRDVVIAPTKQSGSPWDQSGEADPYVGIRVEGSSPNALEFGCRAQDTLFIACDLSQNPFDVTPSTKISIRALDEDALFNDTIGASAENLNPMKDCLKDRPCDVITNGQLQSFSLEFHRIQ